MKLYKDSANVVYTYPSDGSQDHLIGDKTPITKTEADALAIAKMAAMGFSIPPAYVSQRQMEYPSIADQLDAMWKGGTEAAVMRAKIQAVKAKYPKA
jgi:hypothetical protein